MQYTTLLASLLTLVTFTLASPIAASEAIESPQLNVLLCPLLGTPLCSPQCKLLTGTDGQCAPNNKCYCADEKGTVLG
ncbi:unnamed protein product [Zymoseptoria tritici ST99CH_1A5]|uniref:Invertebrate defensins family profile domain-containing protein n=2 Tax=Zymoseptoria tritici TaxID=1047171 RepID=A0A1X7RCQ0_ZYMT9|nr:unnamed protein product [Zymoseptoria tritici ST99CH_3D7]SMY18912.1 unnamed protein product [Zymoseptoria tritici ST99CH_1A5]